MIKLSIGIILSACIFNQKVNSGCESDSKRKLHLLFFDKIYEQFWKVDQKMKIVCYFHNFKKKFLRPKCQMFGCCLF